MTQKLIDLYRHILQYDNDIVYIAFHSKTLEPYFHAKQVCQLLGYANPNDILKKLVDKKNMDYLKNIVVNYKLLYILPYNGFF